MHNLILGQYKDLNLVEPDGFKDEDLDKAVIESILNSLAHWCKYNALVEKGDYITIKIEAKESESGILVPEFCQNTLQYTVGDPNYLNEFSNSVGKKFGESFEMEISFDENASVERVRNKKVVFNAAITDVRHNKMPELTDDLIQKLDPECQTLEQLKTKYADIIRSRTLANIEEQKRNLVLKTIIDNSYCEFDQAEFEKSLNAVTEKTRMFIVNSNAPNVDLFLHASEEDEIFKMDCERITRQMILESLVINEICVREQIFITPEELALEKAKYTEDEMAIEEFTKYFSSDQSFELYLLKEKVLDWLSRQNFVPMQ
jgi:trigger factor